MFCEFCGTEIEDGAEFCPNCGANLGDVVKTDAENTVTQTATVSEATQDVTQSADTVAQPVNNGNPVAKKPMNKNVVIAICAAIAVVVLAIIIMAQPKKYNVEDYVKVSYDGCHGYATAHVFLDEEKLCLDILKDKDIYVDEDSWRSATKAEKAEINKVIKAVKTIKIKLTSKKEKLKNGDKVEVAISYNNELAKANDIKFKGKKVSKKVEGLKKVKKVDAFQDLEVTFSGTAPNGSIGWAYTGDVVNIYDSVFSPDKTSGLRNGDVVTFTIDLKEKYTLSHGYVISQTEKQYTVEGLDEYVSKYSNLTEEFLGEMKKEAEDIICAYTAGSYSSDNTVSDLKYAGYVFSAVKDSVEYVDDWNRLYLIYTGTVAGKTVYYPVAAVDILKNSNGLSYEKELFIVGSSRLAGVGYTKGYTNPVECYKELTEDGESYDSESGDGFEKYASYKTITKLSDISEEYKNALYEEAKATIQKSKEDNYLLDFTLGELTAVGEYLLVAKEKSNYVEENRYVLVCSGTLSSPNREPVTVYFPVEYDGVVSLADKEFLYSKAEGVLGLTAIPNSFYSTNGYIDGTEMYSKIITANRDKYNYEVSTGLQQFGK